MEKLVQCCNTMDAQLIILRMRHTHTHTHTGTRPHLVASHMQWITKDAMMGLCISLDFYIIYALAIFFLWTNRSVSILNLPKVFKSFYPQKSIVQMSLETSEFLNVWVSESLDINIEGDYLFPVAYTVSVFLLMQLLFQ